MGIDIVDIFIRDVSIFEGGRWPDYDASKTLEDAVKIAVQVNGKLRGTVELAKGTEEAQAVAIARVEENVARHLEGVTERKVIFVQDRLINFVAS